MAPPRQRHTSLEHRLNPIADTQPAALSSLARGTAIRTGEVRIANHASTRTTQLHDRRHGELSLERIAENGHLMCLPNHRPGSDQLRTGYRDPPWLGPIVLELGAGAAAPAPGCGWIYPPADVLGPGIRLYE